MDMQECFFGFAIDHVARKQLLMLVCAVLAASMSSLLTTCDSVDIRTCVNRINRSFLLVDKPGLKVVFLEKE